MPSVNVPDFVILLIVAGFFLRSFFRGAVKELFSLLALFTGYVAAVRYGWMIAEKAVFWTGDGIWVRHGGYAAVFIVVWLGVNLIGTLASRLVRSSAVGLSDRIGGGILGGVKGVLLISAGLLIVQTHFSDTILDAGKGERVMPWIRRVSVYLRYMSPAELNARIKEMKRLIGPEMEGREKYDLPRSLEETSSREELNDSNIN